MSGATTLWQDAVRAALLGTERQPPAWSAAAGDSTPLERALGALADRPAEPRLLAGAAVLALFRAAGFRPATDPRPAPPPAPAAARACRPEAAAVLNGLLRESSVPLVAEWLALAGAAGCGAPAELLPALLDFGGRQPAAREAVAAGLDDRGRWLAAQNPDWAFALDADEPRVAWETGSAEDRLRALRRLRRRDPGAERELVLSSWEQEGPRERVAILAALAEGLGDADEPFLESVLDDRRKDVRAAAARLLARLPGSRLAARMTERAGACLSLAPPSGGLAGRLLGARATVQVRLPAECDASMRRDGIEPKPAAGYGERAWWLRQVLAAVPPATWSERWGLDAPSCIEAARGSDDRRLLLDAWGHAAAATGDPGWIEALLRAETVEEHGLAGTLAALLPAERLEALILEKLGAAGRLHSGGPVLALLEGGAAPLGARLTRELLLHLPPEAASSDWRLRDALRPLALRMDPASAVNTLHAQGDPHAGAWVDLLHLRHAMHRAFSR
jgi:hypothetical protein